MARERIGHLPSFDKAKNMKLLMLDIVAASGLALVTALFVFT